MKPRFPFVLACISALTAASIGACGSDADAPSTVCGDQMVQAGEQCDGQNLNGQTCQSVTMNPMATGTLACDTSCRLVTSGCTTGAGGGTGSGGGTGTGGI